VRAWEVSGAFGLENLVATERPDAEPGPGEVRVRVRAASLNFRDLLMARGRYNPRQPLPFVPCSDGAGVVDAVGAGVTRWKVGDRVCPIFAQSWHAGPPTRELLASTLGGPLDGTLREAMVVPEGALVATPAHLDDVEAATLPCAAVTAWSALAVHGGLKAGETVLVLGTGGVSIFALQIARLFGARVIATSSSDEKAARAVELGAHEVVNYRTHPEWWREVLRLTDGAGVDHVIEVGGAGTFDQSVRALRPGGHMALIGVLAGPAEINLTRMLMMNIRAQGIVVGHRAAFEEMNRALALHGVHPVIDRVFAFDEAPAAFAHLAGAGHLGKVCIRLD
jgi:NADPH:quinone reductase-like Zn-dependent oxidoreductase